METKKLAFSEHILSRRRKVVSGFGLGVGASIILLTVILLSTSLKPPTMTTMFQGFSGFRANSSIVSWPFSYSSTSLSSSYTGSSTATTAELQNSVDLREGIEEGRVQEKTQEANVSEIAKIENAMVTDGTGVVMEKTHLVGEDKNGTFIGEEARVRGNDHVGNFPGGAKNGSFSVPTIEGVDLEKTHMGNFSQIVKNGNFSAGERVIGKDGQGNFSQESNNTSISGQENVIAEKNSEGQFVGRYANASCLGECVRFTKNFNNGNVTVTENKHAGNVSNNENLRSPGEEERASEIKHVEDSAEKNNIAYHDSQLTKLRDGLNGECDIFNGRWVRDDSKPYYPAGSCPYIDRDFDCHLNRRPDDGFLRWKWQPNHCDIPRMNATDFLERLRGKKLVFVGDSLNRNMWESLVCILHHSVRKKKRVYEISGRREFKKKGFYAFRFEDYNCTVDFVSSPFLVRESSFKGRNGTFDTLRLDLMDQTTSMYHDADVIIFNTGHWWTHEKTSKGEYYYQEGNHVYPKLKVLEAYKKALTTWAQWVDKNIDSSRAQVIFRGYSVTHFRGGQWNSGGQCHKEVEPIFNETYLAKYPSKMRMLEHVLQEIKTPVMYLNISRLTDYRKDGHPSIYRMEYKTAAERIAAERSQDCSHWCLPGVPDTWNELLYASLLKSGRGSWKS